MKTRTEFAVIWEDGSGNRGIKCIYSGAKLEEQQRIAILQADAWNDAEPDKVWLVERRDVTYTEVWRTS